VRAHKDCVSGFRPDHRDLIFYLIDLHTNGKSEVNRCNQAMSCVILRQVNEGSRVDRLQTLIGDKSRLHSFALKKANKQRKVSLILKGGTL